MFPVRNIPSYSYLIKFFPRWELSIISKRGLNEFWTFHNPHGVSTITRFSDCIFAEYKIERGVPFLDLSQQFRFFHRLFGLCRRRNENRRKLCFRFFLPWERNIPFEVPFNYFQNLTRLSNSGVWILEPCVNESQNSMITDLLSEAFQISFLEKWFCIFYSSIWQYCLLSSFNFKYYGLL